MGKTDAIGFVAGRWGMVLDIAEQELEISRDSRRAIEAARNAMAVLDRMLANRIAKPQG